MILTKEILEQGKSSRGSWNGKQLAIFGLSYNKLQKGWKKRIIGRDYSEDKIKRFLELRNTHLVKNSVKAVEKERADSDEFDTFWRKTKEKYKQEPEYIPKMTPEQIKNQESYISDLDFMLDIKRFCQYKESHHKGIFKNKLQAVERTIDVLIERQKEK